jgi:hypothetical protein
MFRTIVNKHHDPVLTQTLDQRFKYAETRRVDAMQILNGHEHRLNAALAKYDILERLDDALLPVQGLQIMEGVFVGKHIQKMQKSRNMFLKRVT